MKNNPETISYWKYRWEIDHDIRNHYDEWRPLIIEVLKYWKEIKTIMHFSEKYKDQRILCIDYKNRVYFLFYVYDIENPGWIFIKTCFYSTRLQNKIFPNYPEYE